MTEKKPTGPDAITIARMQRNYKPGDPVRIVRGDLAGRVLTIREDGPDHVALVGMPRRDIVSKGIVEPEEGFTDLEMQNAETMARQGA